MAERSPRSLLLDGIDMKRIAGFVSAWFRTRLRTKGLGVGLGIWMNPLEGRRVLTISFLFWTWHYMSDAPEEEPDHEGDYGYT